MTTLLYCDKKQQHNLNASDSLPANSRQVEQHYCPTDTNLEEHRSEEC